MKALEIFCTYFQYGFKVHYLVYFREWFWLINQYGPLPGEHPPEHICRPDINRISVRRQFGIDGGLP